MEKKFKKTQEALALIVSDLSSVGATLKPPYQLLQTALAEVVEKVKKLKRETFEDEDFFKQYASKDKSENMELTRFRGYITLWGGGIHDAENTKAVS